MQDVWPAVRRVFHDLMWFSAARRGQADILLERLGILTGSVADDEADIGPRCRRRRSRDDALDALPTGGAVKALLEPAYLAWLCCRNARKCWRRKRNHSAFEARKSEHRRPKRRSSCASALEKIPFSSVADCWVIRRSGHENILKNAMMRRNRKRLPPATLTYRSIRVVGAPAPS